MYSRLIKKQYLELKEAQKEDDFVKKLEKRYDVVDNGLHTEKNPLVLEYFAITKMIVGTRLSLEYRTEIFLLMLLVLSRRIDKLYSRKSGLTKKELAAEEKLDDHLARRLSELLDMKGHEAMYDTGTKPSRNN